ncbi:peptide chain release factor N(5)-glutamine methyltransferase [Nocardia sp. alder85J]|uniref:peptide chain release factor N(5)-glutamine methyltransferase n=1 Tax=Nocardia sp. alder85J TaxID=2862949 RepID=UPI001CD64E41|nr:peptide chain release factor N(5)-glutamine methyltransferase [Nocardia sp. alder85J]MCX4097360.1 peptide chain release factor N(5)-glutamine methyltransferase [Nocardia sp. alder85J]
MSRVPLRSTVVEATETLAAAGVHSPYTDAELLAAHVLGVERTRLALVPMLTPEQLAEYRRLVEQRATRVPLQYLTGVAAMGEIDLCVGPGVFVPRPETELLFAWALAHLDMAERGHRPTVVDLCTGSGALALAIAHARPDTLVHAVELDPVALKWAQRNSDRLAGEGDAPIALYEGDATDPAVLAELDGRVDMVVSNPPYIPAGAELDPEVIDHDPHLALFGGADGLSVIRPMIGTIARLLRPGGVVAVEHDDSHGAVMAELFDAHDGFLDVAEHTDLAGKPRFITARRMPTT